MGVFALVPGSLGFAAFAEEGELFGTGDHNLRLKSTWSCLGVCLVWFGFGLFVCFEMISLSKLPQSPK